MDQLRTQRRRRDRRLRQDSRERASREDLARLLDQLSYPRNRLAIEDFAAFMPVLLREARIAGLPIPWWLARSCAYREPPPPLRLVRGGKRDAGSDWRRYGVGRGGFPIHLRDVHPPAQH